MQTNNNGASIYNGNPNPSSSKGTTCILSTLLTLCMITSISIGGIGGIYTTAQLHETTVERSQLFDTAAITSMVLGALGLVLTTVGCLEEIYQHENRRLLIAYTSGVGLLVVTHAAVAVWMMVEIPVSMDRKTNNERLLREVRDFHEDDVNSVAAKEFVRYGCCSIDGDVAAFWEDRRWVQSRWRENGRFYSNRSKRSDVPFLRGESKEKKNNSLNGVPFTKRRRSQVPFLRGGGVEKKTIAAGSNNHSLSSENAAFTKGRRVRGNISFAADKNSNSVLRNIPVQCCINYRDELHKEFFLEGDGILKCLGRNASPIITYGLGCFEKKWGTSPASKYLFINPIVAAVVLYYCLMVVLVYELLGSQQAKKETKPKERKELERVLTLRENAPKNEVVPREEIVFMEATVSKEENIPIATVSKEENMPIATVSKEENILIPLVSKEENMPITTVSKNETMPPIAYIILKSIEIANPESYV